MCVHMYIYILLYLYLYLYLYIYTHYIYLGAPDHIPPLTGLFARYGGLYIPIHHIFQLQCCRVCDIYPLEELNTHITSFFLLFSSKVVGLFQETIPFHDPTGVCFRSKRGNLGSSQTEIHGTGAVTGGDYKKGSME